MKIVNKIGLLAAMFAFCACGSDETIGGGEEPKVETELKEYTVSLKLGGEVTTSDSPLARTETESTDLYGVQVYKGANIFASGLFDNVSDMKINLLEGSTYKFVVLLVKDGKNIVSYQDIYYGSGYIGPFGYTGRNDDGYNITIGTECSNTYTFYRSFVDNLAKGGYYETDTYYGEISDYTPTVNGTITIDMKHTVFGLQYEVTGITDGTASITIKNDTKTFFTNSSIAADYTSEEKIISFADVYNAWQYADNYTENLTVSVSWTRGVGVVQDLGTKTIQVKRNVMNVVRVKLGSNDGSATFGITTEDDSEMTEETVDIPLE